jgi:hypothetical protein
MKKVLLLLLLLNIAGASSALNNRQIRGIAEIAAGAATIGLSIFNVTNCKKDWNSVAEHPIKTILFNRHGISDLVKGFGVRTGVAAAAIFGLGLPLCYLGMFALLHKPEKLI